MIATYFGMTFVGGGCRSQVLNKEMKPQTQASEKQFSLTAAIQNNNIIMEITDQPVSSTWRQ